MTKFSGIIHTAFALLLLLLFGVSAYLLTAEAGGIYGRLSAEQEQAFRLRVAANYITNHVRRMDTVGGVLVADSPFGDCIVLREEIDGEAYETRIYFHDGFLWESFVPAASEYDPYSAFEVIELDGLDAAFADSALRLTLTAGDEVRPLSVALMSGGIR